MAILVGGSVVYDVSPSYASWPTDEELVSMLESAGFVVPGPSNAVGVAVAEWERLTGWQPFLGPVDGDDEPVASTFAYDPPAWGCVLQLRRGFVTVDEIAVGVSAEDPDGTVLAASGYDLLPMLETPTTEIRFRSAWGGGPGSVRVTGQPGYCSSLPHDAYDAVLKRAASLLLAQTLPVIASAGTVKQGSLTLDVGAMLTGWNTTFERAAARYLRIDL